MWTVFKDMFSGGSVKIRGEAEVYIEGTEEEAVRVFMSKYGRDPYNITCSCCGPDYVIYEYSSLKDATKFRRSPGESVEDFLARRNVVVLYKGDENVQMGNSVL